MTHPSNSDRLQKSVDPKYEIYPYLIAYELPDVTTAGQPHLGHEELLAHNPFGHMLVQ